MITQTIRLATVAGMALIVAVASAGGASAQERVKWKMQSAWASNLIHLGTSGVRFAKNIERVSGGNFQIKFYEPGALVPALECFDAASKGSVEACWTTPGYHTGKIPALAFFTTVPFGPPYGEFFAWKKFHGGDDLKNEIYAEHGLYSIDGFATGPETSGWFRQRDHLAGPAQGPEDALLRPRRPGHAEDGRVDPAARRRRHLPGAGARGDRRHRVSRCPTSTSSSASIRSPRTTIIPAGISKTSVAELLMNKAAWDKLPDTYKAMLELAAGESIHYTYAESEAMNPAAMAEMKSKYGVTNRRWTDEELAAFEKAWFEVLAEEIGQGSDFQEDRRQLPGVAQGVQALGRRAGLEGYVPDAVIRSDVRS